MGHIVKSLLAGLCLLVLLYVCVLFVAIVFPQKRPQSKLRQLDSTFHAIQNSLALYATQKGHGGYPPAYGYLLPSAAGKAAAGLRDRDYVLASWGTFVSLNKTTDIYDVFGRSTDANQNQVLELLEYSPIGERPNEKEPAVYSKYLYRGDKSAFKAEYNAQIDSKQVPVRYVPVNLAQFNAANKYWIEEARDPLATTWNPASSLLKDLKFPPPKYDAYVLISVGPSDNSFDLFGDPPAGAPAEYAYHIAALRTYFLATRDLNEDNRLDFDFEQSEDERAAKFKVKLPNGETYPADNRLPSRTYPVGNGPKIFLSN